MCEKEFLCMNKAGVNEYQSCVTLGGGLNCLNFEIKL